MELLDRLAREMILVNRGDPKRIQHFLKVREFARLIAAGEGLDERSRFTLEAAALVHDIAIRRCELIYGSCNGKLQEQEGPALARELLTALEFEPDVVERVCFLVGHHHTYDQIDGMDYQILVEADFLVNLYEDEAGEQAVETALERIFRTRTGRELCQAQFWAE